MNVISTPSSHLVRRIRIFWLCLFLLPGLAALAAAEDKQPFSPYFETFTDGKIDWENGLIYGVGKGYLHQNQNSKNRALRAAQVIAQQSILKVAARIRLNDQQTLDSLEREIKGMQLKAFVQSSQDDVTFQSEGDQPHFVVTMKAPLTGIEGLTINLLKHLRNSVDRWQAFPQPSKAGRVEDEDAPWLILDARRLMAGQVLKPALFPKIISASGRTIYDLKTVEENALTQNGMARYAISDMTPSQLLSEQNRRGNLVVELLQKLLVRPAYAGEDKNKKKRKRRKYIITDAKKAQGLMKTNLIISEKDARNMTTENDSSRILKDCRVIILISSPVGGIEGRIPHYLVSAL
jgi:hypothetical protein